jgi:hypothetical protein
MKKSKRKVRLAPRQASAPTPAPAPLTINTPVTTPADPDSPPYAIYKDHQARTCIEVERTDKLVKFITMATPEGLVIETMTPILFDHRFKQVFNYPIKKACSIYAEYGRMVGATKEAISYLRKAIPITNEQELRMSKTQNSKDAAKKTASGKPAKAAAKTGEKRESAAQMFQDLIMKGTFSDDVIFKKVQEKFGLDDKKRGYVTWYRNYLRKQGKKPPEAKGSK